MEYPVRQRTRSTEWQAEALACGAPLYSPGSPFQSRPGRVLWFLSDEKLHVAAVFPNCQPSTLATGDQQALWLLGDSFEVFLARPERPQDLSDETGYWEFQAAPNGRRLGLFFDSPKILRTFRKSETFDIDSLLQHFAIPVDGVDVESNVDAKNSLWSIRLGIPLDLLGGCPVRGEIWFGHSSRYETHSDHPPTLSSTAKFPKANFHDLSSWHRLHTE